MRREVLELRRRLTDLRDADPTSKMTDDTSGQQSCKNAIEKKRATMEEETNRFFPLPKARGVESRQRTSKELYADVAEQITLTADSFSLHFSQSSNDHFM